MRRSIGATALGHLVRGLAGAVAGVVLALASTAAEPGAPEASTEGYTMELWTGLMSPYCPGRLLIDCPSGQADALRERIAQEEASGRTRDEVVSELYAEFGDIIWQAPRAQGFGWAAYLIPLAAGLAGVAVVATFLRRQRAAPPSARPMAKRPTLDPELERRIDAEMNELRP